MRTAVDFHFDPMCPFTHQASMWIRDVRTRIGITISWRFFSLEETNRAEGKKHPWERQWSYGWSLMRIGALLRRTDMSLLDRWYAAIGQGLHTLGGKPHDPVVARRRPSDIVVGSSSAASKSPHRRRLGPYWSMSPVCNPPSASIASAFSG
jgi:hypothetical protein